ncbi:MAG: hypothetical protein J2P17_09430 [Mycobacterium sp.]|nr:hypothetical protein [Mycobacterium sp.]
MARQPAEIEFIGLRTIRRDLKKLNADEFPQAMINAGLAVSEPLAGRVRTALPFESGDLQRTVRTARIRTGAALRVGTKRVPYAPWIEFGGTRRRPHISSRPFIRDGRYIFPAARQAGPEAVIRYATEIQKVIDRFAWSPPRE